MPSPSTPTLIPFTSPQWHPLDPSHPLLSPDQPSPTETRLGTTTKGNTDWWRAPPDIDRRTGPTLGFWRDGGKFEVSVDIGLEPRVQYDQATIFLYVSPTQWVKAGVEFDNGKMWDGSVVTSPYSDWAIAPHTSQSSKRFTIAYNPPELKIFQGGDMVREVKFFGHAGSETGIETEAGADKGPGKVFVGIMGCSPKEGGAEVVWERFEMREGVRE